MKTPLISIIVPVYNASNFIWRCLDSLLNQTYKNIEIVCIDDWSKDDSLEIISDYSKKDKRFVVISQKNQWAWIARNNWIKIANWNFITFVDSDDALEYDALEEIVNFLSEDTDIIISWIKIVDNNWKFFRTRIPDEKQWIYIELKFTSTQFKLYRRDLLISNNIGFWSCKIHEDLLFNVKAFSLTNKIKILSSAKYLNYQKCNPEWLTSNMKNELCNQEIISDLLRKIIDTLLYYKKYHTKTISFFSLKILIQDVFCYNSPKNINDIYIKNYKYIEKQLWKIWFYWQRWEEFKINFIINVFIFLTKFRLTNIIFWLKIKLLDK